MGKKLRALAIAGLSGVVLGVSYPAVAAPVAVRAEAAEAGMKFEESTDILHIGVQFQFIVQKGDVTWSVSDDTIASIDSKTGILTGKKTGIVTVTATELKTKKTLAREVTVIGNDISSKFRTFKKVYKNKNGKKVMTLTYEYPEITGQFPGIPKINKNILEQKTKWQKAEKESIETAKKESVDKISKEYFRAYEDDVVSQLTYNNNNLICILQSGYYYAGGAHGMPYRTPSVYNLKTGSKIGIRSLMKGTDQEIKNRVTAAFKEIIDQESDGYWPDAMDTVKKTPINKLRYYLTPKGICFYFEPYELSAYARGYVEAVIPYSDTDAFRPALLK